MLSFTDVSLGTVLRSLSFTTDGKSLCIVSDSENERSAIADIICGVICPDGGTVCTSEKIPLLAKDAPLPSFFKCSEYLKAVASDGLSQYACELTEDMADIYISALSRFEREKLGIIAIFETDGKYFFAEEPTAGLDPDEAAQIIELMHSPEHKKTAVFTSSSLNAMLSAELVLAVSKGRAEFFGAPSEFIEKADALGILTVRIMGSKEKIQTVFDAIDIEISECEKQNSHDVTFPEGLSVATVKEMMKGTGLVFISAKKDNDKIKSILTALRRTDESNAEKAEQKKAEQTGSATLDASVFAFSRTENIFEPDEDDEDNEDDERLNEDNLFEQDEETGEYEEESTLFGKNTD